MKTLSEKRAHVGLSRLARFASARGINPENIDDSAIEGFIAGVREGSRAADPGGAIQNFLTAWHTAFSPINVRYGFRQGKRMDSFDYIARSTLMRPRDFIRYIQVCADSDARLGKTHIDPETVRREDKSFSNYLRNEIEDEIHGLLPDIKAILDTLANLRKTEFKGDEFRAVYSAALDKGSVTTKDPKFVLQVLFHFSVIGNRPRQKLLQFFRYSNKEARFNVNENAVSNPKCNRAA